MGGYSWRVSLLILLAGLAVLSMLLFGVTRDLSGFAKWGLKRIIPGTSLSVGSLKFTAPGEVTGTSLVLRDSNTGDVLVSMSRGIIRFRWDGLWNRRFSEVKLEEPIIHLSPRFFELFRGDPSASPNEKMVTWQIDVLQCSYGQLSVETSGNLSAYIYSRFSFDLKDFGVGKNLSDRLHEMVFWGAGLSLQPDFSEQILGIDLLRLRFTLDGLLKGHQIDSIYVQGGDLNISEAESQLVDSFQSKSNAEASDTPSWTIGALDIFRIRTHVAPPRPQMAGIAFELTTKLANLPLGNVVQAIGAEQQMVELANLEIVSPVDPLMRILTLRSVFVRFTLEGIAHKEVQEVVIVSPTIYLTQDLFTYMRQMREASGAEAITEDTSDKSWIIRQLRVALGRLVLGGERIGEIGLPLEFRTLANDVAFNNLASLQLKAVLEVRNESYDFVALQLSLENLYGNLRFAYPPKKAPNNLVNVLYLDQLRWRQFQATDLWLSATFEEAGISAEFGGKLYEGYFNAGVAFSFGGESRWVGWVTGSNIDLKSVTTVLAPENVTLTSPADFRVEVDASGQDIERLIGEVNTTKPGHMEITKLDEVIKRIPGDWSALKKSSSRIALETLRDYEYDTAKATFWFVNKQGKLNLKLMGPTGHRDFEAVLQEADTEKRKWNE